jgi:hypothetical protein
MPAPVNIEADPTTRLTVPVEPATPPSGDVTTQLPAQPQPADTGGDATQVVPLPSGEPPTEETPPKA